MNTAIRKQGTRLTKVERQELLLGLIDALQSGYMSKLSLARKLNVSRQTIDSLMPEAEAVFATVTKDRNIIRNLQVQRTYAMIDRLAGKLDNEEHLPTLKEELAIHDKIIKYGQHLALITGLNVETHINVDSKQLVIIRPATEPSKDATVSIKPAQLGSAKE